jgi:hypothetical protein
MYLINEIVCKFGDAINYTELQKRGSVGWSEGVGDSRIIGFGHAFSF